MPVRSVHFVGSGGLDAPSDVYAAIGQHCGPFLKRIPAMKIADGVSPDDIHFGELGYAREARPSYEDFVDARRAGQIPSHVRFQVSLPTPWAVVTPFCRQPDAQQVLPAYEKAMLREVARICDAIPHRDLAIQRDVCVEMLAWDERWPNAPAFPGMAQAFGANFAKLGASVPSDVELGFHLCYGDLDGKHFIEPVDATKWWRWRT